MPVTGTRNTLLALGIFVPWLVLGGTPPLASQQPEPTSSWESALGVPTEAMVRGYLRFLSDDLLRGRAPGTAGADLAARYIASQFDAMGLEPAGPAGSFFQPVELIGVTPDPTIIVGTGRRTTTVRYLEDFVAWPERPDTLVVLDGDIVFVGYGIAAPEWQWDDYKGSLLDGKILLILSGDPGRTDSTIFNGSHETRYGDPEYKLDQAARVGASGAILVHNPGSDAVPWSTIRGMWSGEIVRVRNGERDLRFGAWMTHGAASRFVGLAGVDFDAMVRRAERSDFRPIQIAAHAAVDINTSIRVFEAPNVVARIPGAPAGPEAEAVVLTAHYDHLGVRQPIDGDSIYNGSETNASGVAALLATAEGFAAADASPQRAVYFVATTAGEDGAMGANSYVHAPPIPLERAVVVLNVNRANLWGRTTDLVIVGQPDSAIVPLMNLAAEAEGMQINWVGQIVGGAPFQTEYQPFSQAGLPFLTLEPGIAFENRSPGWSQLHHHDYLSNRFRQPGDEFRDEFVYVGVLQQVRVLSRIAWSLAEMRPEWLGTPVR